MTMSIISPSGMIDYRVQANPVDPDSVRAGDRCLFTNVAEPIGPLVVLYSGLRDHHRFAVPEIKLTKDFRQRPVGLMIARYLSPIWKVPLIVEIIVQPDNVQRVESAPELGFLSAGKHVKSFEL